MSVKLNRIKRYYLYRGLDLYGVYDSMEECESRIMDWLTSHPECAMIDTDIDGYLVGWEVREATSFSKHFADKQSAE